MHKNKLTSQILNMLLVAAFVLSGISPACKFISGETLLVEICKSDGSVETVALNYGANGEEPTRDNPEHAPEMKNDCAFCFSHTNLQSLAGTDFNVLTPIYNGQDGMLARGEDIARHSANHLYAPRGPPVFAV